jgi:hypothetical protein
VKIKSRKKLLLKDEKKFFPKNKKDEKTLLFLTNSISILVPRAPFQIF